MFDFIDSVDLGRVAFGSGSRVFLELGRVLFASASKVSDLEIVPFESAVKVPFI
jgi:hypothetical protein